MSDTPDGYYAQFAEGMSLLLMGAGVVCIGLGSAFYHEYFVTWHSDLPTLSETIDGFITHPDK